MSDLTGETVELLQAMIRNECVNDGTAESGFERRNADTLEAFLGDDGPRRAALRADAGPGVARRPHRGHRPDRAEPVPHGPHRRRAGEPGGWSRDPFGGELVDGEVWGRGAIDMLNLTASMAVAFRSARRRGLSAARRPHLLRGRRRGVGQRARRAVDGRPRARRDPRRLRAHRERRTALRAGGGAVHRSQRGREGRGVAASPRAGHPGSRVDAVPQRQRAREGRGASSSGSPTIARSRSSTSCGGRASRRSASTTTRRAMLLDPTQIDEVLAAMPNVGAAAHLHAMHAHDVLRRTSPPAAARRT